jgi:hypothetical protein
MDIEKLSGHDFEDLVEKLIKKLGFITEERKKSADGGIDIKAINEKPITKGTYIIQCKRYSNAISESVIRDLYGVVTSERANKGILITNSKFSKQAKKFASALPIELIDGKDLAKLFFESFGKGFEEKNEEDAMPEKCRIVYEYLEPEERRIRKRRKDINDKRVYLEPKFYRSIKAYQNYSINKIEKISKIAEVFLSQINNINTIWNSFLDNQDNYKNIKELRNWCEEIIETINLVEKEQEELISVNPPYNLSRLHQVIIDTYNPFFNFFSEFLHRLSLTKIEDLKDPRLQKYLTIENGQKVIDMHLTLSFDEKFEAISRELESISKDIQKNNTDERRNCYIATVIYKDMDAPEVIKLRKWRDDVLFTNLFGRVVIDSYYLVGKYLAKSLNRFTILKIVIKYFLDKFVNRIKD